LSTAIRREAGPVIRWLVERLMSPFCIKIGDIWDKVLDEELLLPG